MRRSTLALFIAPALVAAVQALAASSMPAGHLPMNPAPTACEAARLASWFEAQRQLTDGSPEPAKPIAAPSECVRSDGRADGMAKRMDRPRLENNTCLVASEGTCSAIS